jgi:hypothetical protein
MDADDELTRLGRDHPAADRTADRRARRLGELCSASWAEVEAELEVVCDVLVDTDSTWHDEWAGVDRPFPDYSPVALNAALALELYRTPHRRPKPLQGTKMNFSCFGLATVKAPVLTTANLRGCTSYFEDKHMWFRDPKRTTEEVCARYIRLHCACMLRISTLAAGRTKGCSRPSTSTS